MIRKLLVLGLAFWILRWIALELAARAGNRWLERGPPPIESDRAPGWMPGTFNR